MCTSKMKMVGAAVLTIFALCFAAAVFLYGTLSTKSLQAAMADEPVQAAVPTGKRGLHKELLATWLQQGVLGNERQHIARLDEILKLYEAMSEGGSASVAELQDIEEELLKARIRVSRRQARYNDSLEEIRLRHGVDAKGLQMAEELVLQPLARQLEGF